MRVCAFKSFLRMTWNVSLRLTNMSSTTSTFEVPVMYPGKWNGLRPKVISYSVEPVPTFHEVLWDHSTQSSNLSQELGWRWTKAQRYCSITQFRTSVWLSLCVWYAKLMRSWVLLSQNNSCQNRLMKRRSQSKTKLQGMPWVFPTISINRQATVWAVWDGGSILKWIPLGKRSTTTRITVFPWYSGRSMIKSNERSSQGRWGTGRGHNSPASLLISYFYGDNQGNLRQIASHRL